MRLRPTQSSPLSLLLRATVTALIVLGGHAARAADEDPFAGEAPGAPSAKGGAPPNPQAPPSAPPPSSSELPSGLVERLPSSAYPEPVTRGLYGGSMWMTFHGLQWPYYPRTGIGVSGYGWLDNSYERIKRGDATQPSIKEWLQQGRVLLRVTPTYTSGDWFVQAQAELVANKDQSRPQPEQADVDDLWIRTGQWRLWDVSVGRFEAFEVYHLGMGLDLNTEERNGAYDVGAQPPDLYGATFLFYRPAAAGDLAFHLYPTRTLRLELLGQVGNAGGLNTLGGRPAIVFDLGWLKLKAAAEYAHQTARNDGDRTEGRNRGGAGSVQFVFAPFVEFGLNGGYALADLFDNVGTPDTGRSYTKISFGGFLNLRVMPDMLLGVGANDVRVTDTHLEPTTNSFGHFNNLQTFAAVQYLIRKQLFVKVVGSYATADFNPSFTNMTPHSNTMYSGRIRLTYLF